MKRKITFLIAAVVMLFLNLLPQTVWADDTYVKVTSSSQITAGSQIIIVCEGNNAAMTATSSNYPGASVTISSTTPKTITLGANSTVCVLTVGGTSGNYTLTYTSNNTNYQLSWKSNGLQTNNTTNNNHLWSIDSDGNLSSSSTGAGDRTTIRHNTSNTDKFGCYTTSTGKATCLYVKQVSPSCSVNPTSWNFENVQVGQTATKTFTVTTANLTGALTLSADGAFSVTSPSPASIAQNATTTQVTVTFTPSAVTTYNGSLTISGGGLANNVTVSLTGSGTCTPPTNDLAYTTPVNLTLENGEAEYSLAPTPGTGNGGSITYEVTTNPGGNGDIIDGPKFYAIATGTYVVTATQDDYNNVCGGTATITFYVAGTDPSCEILPAIWEFGKVLTDTYVEKTFTVNTANLEGNLTVGIDHTSDGFLVTPTSINQAATSTNVTVRFAPTNATDDLTATLTISGGGLASDVTALISGQGDAGYTVTFNPYSGTCTPTSIRVIQGESIETLPTATADGATFYGWATSKVASTTSAPSIVSTPYAPAGDVTLHAAYKIAKEFDNTTACAGSYTIYSVVETNDKSTTNYYATGTLNKKYSSTTTASDAKSFTLTKVSGYGNDEWAIKDGDNYVAWSSGTDLATQNSAYKWIITQGTKGTWRITAASTLNSTIRGFVFQGSTTNKFGGYAVSNITPGAAYYDIEFGSASFTYNSETPVAKPTYNLAGGSYPGEQSVTISCTTQGATIYYTTNGSDPTASSSQYNGTITVDETMTIKAIAIKSGMANSTVAYATYSIVPLLTTMDEIFAAASEIGGTAENVAVSFNNWVVSGIAGSDNQIVYVTDNDGKGFIIYKYTNGFALNDKLSGTVAGTPLKLADGSAEFTGLTASAEGLTVTHDGTITPKAKTISQLTSGVNTGAVVTISNLAYDGTNLTDGSSNTIRPNTSLYDYSSVLLSGHDYSSVTGVFVMYNSTKQIHPRSADDIVEVEYDITLNDVPSGCTIGTDGDITTAKYGQSVTLSQSAGAGYRFISWTVMNGVTPVAVTNNAFTMPKSAVTVTATFAPTYAITVNATPENTGAVTAEPNPAIEGETVTLTIEPEDGYALKSLTVYKTGDQSTTVSVSNNAFTMPAYAVTVTAEFGAEYTVTYYRNAVNDDETAELTYGEGADVTILAYDDNDVDFEAPEGKKFVKWTTNADGTGTEYQPDDVIDDIAADYDLYAQWDDIIYHITYNVNGDTSETEDVDYGESTTYQPSLEPLTFIGWKRDDVMVGKTYTPTGITEDITLVAVFGATSEDDITLEVWNDMSTSYPDSEATWPGNQFKYYNVTKGQYTQDTYIQFKSAGGYIYNSADFGAISSVTINYYNSSDHYIAVKVDDEPLTTAESGSAEDVTAGTESNNSLTFTISGNYHYLRIYNTSATNKVNSIVINYEAASPVTVNIINTDTDMDDDIPANTSVVVESGITLTFTGENKGTAENLIIEDGGQLIVHSDGVEATIKKALPAAAAKDQNWTTIASPVKNISIGTPSQAGNVTHLKDVDYALYRYNEESMEWENHKNTEDHADFTTLESGRGYLYSRTSLETLSYVGEVNGSDYEEYTLSITTANAINGFHLIGNPYSHDIYKGAAGNGYAIPNSPEDGSSGYVLASGFYQLKNGTSWTPKLDDGTKIEKGEGILVQATTAGTLRIYNSATKPAKRANHDNIMFAVANSQYEDVTYALFDKGMGLSKINHRDANAPMLFIPQNGENYAIATMSDNTKSFNLSFKAMTTGKYTLSAKANGNYSYLHIFDRMTGEDIDMLLEGEYSFISSPNDNENRFIVNLAYLPNYGESNDIFAYQSGSDIYVTGQGELQIFDITGRQVMTTTINGAESINLSAKGVFIFRLIGSDVKTQKIVVE